MSKTFSFTTLWDVLTAPSRRVTGGTRQRRTRTLAGLSLALLVTLAAIVIAQAAIGQALVTPELVVVALFAVAYLASRTPWPEVGAALLTFGLWALEIALLVIFPNRTVVPQTLAFTVLPILFSTLLMTIWYTIGLTLLNIVGLLVLVLAVPWLDFNDVIVPFAATVALSVLAGAAALVRERDLTLMARQSGEMTAYSRRLQEETSRLAAVAEVGRAITGMRDLDTLLEEVVNLIVSRFGFYHAQVFLVDEVQRYAVLRASTGEVGKQLLARGHRLAVGSQSVIGQVTARGEPLIASDTDTDPIHRRNELLPNTRSEMALPLRVGGRIIGALDIQSETPYAFRAEDVATFQTMADQLAVAIENARLFEQAQRDLQDIEMLNRQLTGEAWRTFLRRKTGGAAGLRADAEGVRPLSESEEATPEGTLSVPLTVRGETIGVLDVRPRDGSPPDEATRSLIEAVAERVALALESTRLSEQTQRQAEREQILSRLSAELQATTNLDVMLRIAAREASRALGTPRGFIHLTMEYGARRREAEES